MTREIIFICTGNTCRSPMAEAFFKKVLADSAELKDKYTTSSAGVFAYDGDGPSPKAQEVMLKEWGLDILAHRSSSMTNARAEQAYLILTMTRQQKEAICYDFPAAAAKTFTLKEYVRSAESGMHTSSSTYAYDFTLDISDPYGKSVSEYSRCSSDIKAAVDRLAKML